MAPLRLPLLLSCPNPTSPLSQPFTLLVGSLSPRLFSPPAAVPTFSASRGVRSRLSSRQRGPNQIRESSAAAISDGHSVRLGSISGRRRLPEHFSFCFIHGTRHGYVNPAGAAQRNGGAVARRHGGVEAQDKDRERKFERRLNLRSIG